MGGFEGVRDVGVGERFWQCELCGGLCLAFTYEGGGDGDL